MRIHKISVDQASMEMQLTSICSHQNEERMNPTQVGGTGFFF